MTAIQTVVVGPRAPKMSPEGELLRILVVHNYYQQRGGEDSVVEAEVRLLQERGHAVEVYSRHNDELAGVSVSRVAMDSVWSRRTSFDLTALVEQFRPDAIHVHNTFPLVSPSVYWAAARMSVPVVQTLHNFRLLCPQAFFLRRGRVCEDCLGHVPWRGIVRRCYRGSVTQSGALATMLTAHRILGSYEHKVTRYIALSEFCRNKFIEGGLSTELIRVKPNFVHDPAVDVSGYRQGGLFVGRLSAEKGISTLAEAIVLGGIESIVIIGSGPAEAWLHGISSVELLGFMSGPAIFKKMAAASWLVVPSIWQETFGLVVAEAFACGTPVIASRIGALANLIENNVTGLLVEPGNSRDLADKMRWAQAHPEEMAQMGAAARREYEAKYTPDMNYDRLMEIYRDAIEAAKKCVSSA